MKVTTNELLLDYEGKPIMADGKELTYRQIFFMVLNNAIEGEKMTNDKKMLAFNLSSRLFKGDEIELTVEEAAMIKDRAGKMCLPLIYGRICEVLEGKKENTQEQ